MSDIWSKAPEGATHYNEANEFFYKTEPGLMVYNNARWNESVITVPTLKFIPKPPTIWNGEDLPPVGTECEFINDREWFPCTILFAGRIAVVYEHEGIEYVNDTDDIVFRPIRSVENQAIDKLMKAFYSLHTPTDIATAIYKAGYRLPNA